MVTRRAVLKGTAAASIGAIAAAHGATPAEASVNIGYGNLAEGAVGGFWKLRDAFQVSLKFHKFAADVFLKEQVTGGVAIFFKFFQKEWSDVEVIPLSTKLFPDLKLADLHFSKIEVGQAEFFLKTEGIGALRGTIGTSTDGIFYKFDEVISKEPPIEVVLE